MNITLKFFRFRTFAYKSDNWRSVENFTFEIFIPYFHFACKSDNWRSVENITLENFRFHTFACKSDNWRSVEKTNFRLHTFQHVKVIIGGQ